MTRQTRRPCLDVRESFEATRLSPKFLIEAYAQVVPVRRKTLPKADRDGVAPEPPQVPLRGGEHV
ncbi:hypothetical protein GGE65_008333 [Skermanella aerolata]|uniref:hypothetical protein n=1 Tax=Skermanella aerolata TaxID=393310 RepID=UPI003D1BEF12